MYRYVLIGMVGACAFSGAVLASEQPVPLINPRFEDGLIGWETAVIAQPTQVGIGEGPYASCLYVLGEEGSRAKIVQRISVKPDRWYRATFRYRAVPNGPGGGYLGQFRGVLTDRRGKFIDYPCTIPLLDTFGEWETASAVFKAPLSTGKFGFEFNASGACDVRIDDVALTETAPPAPAPNTWASYITERPEPQWFSSWEYLNQASHFRQMGLKYGWRYVYREQFEGLHESRTTPLWRGRDAYRLYGELGIPACVYLHYPALDIYQAYYDSKPPDDIPRMIDPAWHDAYVKACEEACREYGETPGIAYFFVVDEPFKQYRNAIIPESERESPFWDALDAEVRERFGGGDHGLPEDQNDPDPYRWIAYLSWAAEDLAATFARLRTVIDEAGIDARLLGPDEFAALCPQHWCDLATSVDVFTGQSLNAIAGYRTFNAGFLTKTAADFTGKPVHNATQVPLYGGSPSPEEVQRRYSQVLQNSGDGQMLIGVEWFDRELNHHKYSAPERWETIKSFLQLQSRYIVQTPTHSKAGILFSSPSQMARATSIHDREIQSTYAFCGPILGGWPRMLDSYAVSRERAGFDGLSLLAIPHAPYERRIVYEAVVTYVEQGGTLVVLDPEAFQTDIRGNTLERETLLGATVAEASPQRVIDVTWPIEARLRVHAPTCFVLTPTGEAEVVATYEDGSAAAVRHAVGDGHVLFFGANPTDGGYVIDDVEWQEFWRALLTVYDVPMNLPIWRLRLPDEGLVHAQAPEDVCITGNNFVRAQNGVYLGANRPADGYYTLSVPPDLSPETAEGPRIAFTEGDLTNRTTADDGPFEMPRRVATEPYNEADWANRWSAEALENGLRITFAFDETHDLSRVRFWFTGTMPALELATSAGAGEVATAQLPEQHAGDDVHDIEIQVAGEANRVELRFAPGDAAFALADIEIWAEP